jgi:uncharacterized protein DUF1524
MVATVRALNRWGKRVARLVVLAFLLAPAAAPAQEADPFAGLRVAPEGPRDGYDHLLFRYWRDLDGDGCDTRQEVLVDESLTPADVEPGTCDVVAGEWFSTYDGVTATDPATLDIDHVVALGEAWDSGASAWTPDRRRAYANDLDDPRALVAVTSSSNRAKNDRDPAQWRPARADAWCGFAQAWLAVKVTWDLTADEAEVAALRELLTTC